jgi:hypothetical protein
VTTSGIDRFTDSLINFETVNTAEEYDRTLCGRGQALPDRAVSTVQEFIVF